MHKKASSKPALPAEVIDEIFAIGSYSECKKLLVMHPTLNGGAGYREIRELARSEFGALFDAIVQLLDGVRARDKTSWDKYVQRRSEIEALALELDAQIQAIEAASAEYQFDLVISLAGEALDIARRCGYALPASHVLGIRGLAHLNRGSSDRENDIELAIADHDAALQLALPGDDAASHLMHLALCYCERLRGDRSDNLNVAIDLFRLGIDELGPDSPELLAMICTNLSVAIQRSDSGDRTQNLVEAADLCRVALEYRSPERNAVDWAFSQLNLGEIELELATKGVGGLDDARKTLERVIDEEAAIQQKWLVGAAHDAIGRSFLAAANADAEEIFEAHESGKLDEILENTEDLEEALSHFRKAWELSETDPDRYRRARVLDHLGDALNQLGVKDEAIEVSRQALTVLRPASAPRSCRGVGWRLGNLLAERGEWAESAIAFGDAVEAADLAFHSRLDDSTRHEESIASGSLWRWAAYAQAKDGNPIQATLTLENSRARELRRRLGATDSDTELLDSAPSELKDDYFDALAAVRAASLGDDSAATARRLQEVIEAIRQRPGLRHFSKGIRWDELAGAIEPGWPVVYINPTPHGTVILLIRDSGEEIVSEPMFLDNLKSIDIFGRLLTSRFAEDFEPSDDDVGESYLFGISGHDVALTTSLDSILPWLGQQIAEPVANLLRAHNEIGATIIQCGPLSVAPLHASQWRESGANKCLLDEFEIRYSPSASSIRASLRKAKDHTSNERRLVGVADPNGNLAGAVPELLGIARLFEPGRSTLAFGDRGTCEFIATNAGDASHLHFACHAAGGLFGRSESKIQLSDGSFSAEELTALSLHCRIAVVSACQTALAEISGLPDEAFSIGTSMLIAGSTCSIASLWPVDDLATAMLMTRLYEEMCEHDWRPPEALRRAQLWMRDLNIEEVRDFFSIHPELDNEMRSRAAKQTQHRTRRGAVNGDTGDDSVFSHPYYWASFVALGC